MKLIKPATFILAAALSLGGCASYRAEAQLEQHTILGVNWIQESGEYQALAYQAFNLARDRFDASQASQGKKKAVVVDLDETMIDNSAFYGWQIRNNKAFNGEDWTRWVNARQTAAIAGAVEFNNYVNAHGGKMFYVSNRKDSNEKVATMENLKKAGFTGVSEETLLLKKNHSDKGERFAQIEQQGYEIVLYIGDNLNDFSDEPYKKSNQQRREFVSKHSQDFGKKFIMLPNPNYGGWEEGLAPNYFKHSIRERVNIRNNVLRAWDGK